MMNGLEYAQLKREAYRTTNAANPDEYMDDALIFNAEELEYLEKAIGLIGKIYYWEQVLLRIMKLVCLEVQRILLILCPLVIRMIMDY